MKQTKDIKLDIIENFIQWAYDKDFIGEEAPDLKLEAKSYVLGDLNDEVKDGLTDLINSLEKAIKPFK